MLSLRRSISSRVALAVARYTLATVIAGSWTSVAPASAGNDSFPLACATRDLDVVTLIELQGEAEIVAPVMLAEAYGSLLRARSLCSDGKVPEALAVYRNTFTLLFEEGHRQQGRVADR